MRSTRTGRMRSDRKKESVSEEKLRFTTEGLVKDLKYRLVFKGPDRGPVKEVVARFVADDQNGLTRWLTATSQIVVRNELVIELWTVRPDTPLSIPKMPYNATRLF